MEMARPEAPRMVSTVTDDDHLKEIEKTIEKEVGVLTKTRRITIEQADKAAPVVLIGHTVVANRYLVVNCKGGARWFFNHANVLRIKETPI